MRKIWRMLSYINIDSYNIPVWTLKEVCDKYVKSGQDIHFLKIDVEGWEKQCLKGMDFEHYRPWILCIESAKPTTEDPVYGAWEDIVIGNGYIYAGEKFANRYYVLKEKTDIIERFRDIGHLEDFYNITFYSDSEREQYKKYIRFLQSRALAPLRWVRRCMKKLV